MVQYPEPELHPEQYPLEQARRGPGCYVIEGWEVDQVANGERPGKTRWRARFPGQKPVFAQTLREIKEHVRDWKIESR